MGLEAATLLAWGSLASTAAGAGVSAYSYYQSGKQASEAGKQNNKIAQQEAMNERLAAQENARRQREENRRKLAAMRARLAGSGIASDVGSPADLLAESAGEFELQVQDLFREGQARYSGLLNQGKSDLWQAKQSAAASRYQSLGTLLDGFSATGSNYQGYVDSGAIKPLFVR